MEAPQLDRARGVASSEGSEPFLPQGVPKYNSAHQVERPSLQGQPRTQPL